MTEKKVMVAEGEVVPGLVCVDLRSSDGGFVPPKVVDGDTKELFERFTSFEDTDPSQIRLLSRRLGQHDDIREMLQDIDKTFPPEVLKHALWKHDVYRALTRDAAGGAAGLLDEPICFVLQTPLDGGPFCSFALSKYPRVAKGVYLYDHDDFDPAEMKGGESGRSGWRSTGLQIVTFVEMFLQAHSAYVSNLLSPLLAKVAAVEAALSHAHGNELPDVNALGRTLHACHSDLIHLERRSRFEETVFTAVETIAASNKYGTTPWPGLAPYRAATASRKFDFETLPRRIDNCRATINSLLQRRSEQLNLELTQASHQIAEAALKDSKSMKTIAILTMVLLPGTAVASLFSMNLFNWSATEGSQIASKWLWIYFVIAVPLTGLTLMCWWLWSRDRRRMSTRQHELHARDEDAWASKDEEDTG